MKSTNFTSSALQSTMPDWKWRTLQLRFDLIRDWKIKRLFLPVFFILISLQFSNALDLNRKADSTALFTLYTNAGGSGWINKSGWLTSYITSWYGVTTSTINGSVRVTGISLPNNNLTGTLIINGLPELQVLDVRNNPLPGGSSDYTQNTKLVWIDASNTNMGMPSGIGNLTQLESLNLSNNNITQVGSGGSAIPSSITGLTKLTYLNLQNNKFTGSIPAAIGNLTNLTLLALGQNLLTGTIPIGIGSLTKLTWLDLGNNQITGSIPSQIGNLVLLQSLILGGNQLTGIIPTQIGNLTALNAYLWLGGNQLTGTIPTQIGNLVNVQDLRLDNNLLTGSITAQLTSLTSLTHLYLNSNQLTGPIPTGLGSLSALQYLDIGANQLSGTVPTELNNLINLKFLSICTNLFTGTLPANFLSNSTQLQALYLCNNFGLTGAVPLSCFSSPALTYVNLVSTSFDGLPDISTRPIFSKSNGKVEVMSSSFTFEDIEPNRNIVASKFFYSPQSEISAAPVTIPAQQPLSLSFTVGGSANVYQWQINSVNIPGANSNTYSKTNAVLTDGGNYTLVITNTLVPSLTIKRHVTVTVVGVPTATAATAVTPTGFTANWNAATGAAGYLLDISKDNFATFITGYNSKAVTATTEVVTGLTSNTSYSYRVRATNASSTSANSNIINVDTPPLPICTGGVANGVLATPTSTYQTASFASAGLYKTFTAVQGTLYNFSFCGNGGSATFDTEISILDNAGTATANGYSDDYCGTQSDLTWPAPANGTYRVLITAYNCDPAGGSPATLAYATLSPLNPPAPVATAAFPISPTGFTANWNAVSGATGYRLDVSGDNFATFITGFNDKTVTTTSDAVAGLTASTNYRYRVRAANGNGTSVSSIVISVNTGAVGTAPVAPVAIAATAITSTGFTANWNTVSGATGYRLDISTDNFVTFIIGYNSKSVTSTTSVVTGLTSTTAYKYRVRATNASGTSASSNVIDVTTQVPSPIAPLAIAATTISPTGFTANWNAVTGATGYQLDISADNFATFIAGYNSKVVTAVTEIVTGLIASTAYKYRVRATNGSGTSASSNVIDVTTSPLPTVAPVATAATAISQTNFTANWGAVSGATGYQLDISADNFATFIAGYNSKAVTAVIEVVTGLTANTSYKYRVRATSTAPTSVNSNVIDVTTLPVPVVAAPVATAATLITQTGFTANWNAATGATGYRLDVSSDNFVNLITGFTDKTVSGTSDAVTGLAIGTAYKYRVRAVDATSTSVNSNVIDVTTLAKQNQTITFAAIPDKTLGGAAFALTATASSTLLVSYSTTSDKITISSGQVTLVKAGRATITASQAGDATFNAATSIDQSFCIKPAKPAITASGANTESITLTSSASAGNQWFKDGTAITGATSATLSVTAVGVYKVQVKVDDCLSEFSADTPFIITGDLSIPFNGITIYPNPVEDYLEVRGLKGEVSNSQLSDMTGRTNTLILEQKSAAHRANVQHLAAGVYLLRVQQGKSIYQIKFIKK